MTVVWVACENRGCETGPKSSVILTTEISHDELTGYPKATIWSVIYEKNPKSISGDPVTYEAKMVFDPDVITLMTNGYALLHVLKISKSPDAPEHAYNDMPITEALTEMGSAAPTGKILRQPRSSWPY